jgi:F-type H+-transporting ATPase subunit b
MISSAYAQEALQETHPAGEAGEAGSLAHGGAHESAFPPFETTNFAPQLVWLALVFGLLYLLMSRFALPRIASILSTRETTIGADLDAAREMQAKAQAADTHNTTTLEAKKAEAQSIGRDAQAKIAADVTAMRASAEQKFAAEVAAAEARIAAQKADAMKQVENIATEAAIRIVTKLTGVTVDPATIAAARRTATTH